MAGLGIFGGTFDPPHLGHLILAQCAYEKLKLDKVIFIPAGIQPHKQDKKITSASDRLAMLRLAVCNDPKFEISTLEIDSSDVSYSYKTVQQLRVIYPENELYFLIGGDNISDIDTWMKPEEIFKIAKVAAAKRPDTKTGGRFEKEIMIFDMPQIGISSTDIREMVKTGQAIKYLVPDSVENYIMKNKLYI